MRMSAIDPRKFEDSRQRSRDSANKCTGCAVAAPEEVFGFAFCPFRGGQTIQRFPEERRYWKEDGLAVLHGIEVDVVFANAIASKRGYVADSQSGIPEKKDHGSGPISFVSAVAKLIASREDLNNLLLRIRLFGFWLYAWRFDLLGRIGRDPLAADTNTEEVSQDREFFCPCRRRDRATVSEQVNSLDFDVVELRYSDCLCDLEEVV